jgi:multiple sugar transport system ATP-binding protein
MRSEIKRFHHNLNATIVYVTHDQLEAVTMADKMVVMHGGVLQQYDTPANVFSNPVNTFVASFVGSPAMSLIPVDVATTGAATVLKGTGGWEMPLSDANARKAQSSSSSKAVLGARHSTLKLHKTQKPGVVPGKVHTVEPTGDITFAQVLVDSEVVNISLEPSAAIQPDETVWLEFDQSRMHLFDATTTMALKAA